LLIRLAGVFATVIGASGILLGDSVISTFDTGAEGWVVSDFPDNGPWTTPLATYPEDTLYSPTGGNPGGYLSSKDPNNNTYFLEAPAKFLGDKSRAYGANLSFDLRHYGILNWPFDVDVILVGNGLTIVAGKFVHPDTSWQNFQVSLTESVWYKNAFFRHFLVIFYWPESIWDALSALTRSQEGQQNGLFCPLFVE
jgi:hypothetical protein